MNFVKIAIQAALILTVSACSENGPATVESDKTSEPGLSATLTTTQADGEPSTVTQAKKLEFKIVSSDTDIVGLRLGMTVDEVTEHLKTRNPEARLGGGSKNVDNNQPSIGQYRASIGFSSGKDEKGYPTDYIEVAFSSPPNNVQAIAISRTAYYRDKGTSPELYLESLIDKYGAPDSDNGLNTYVWLLESGKSDCIGYAKVRFPREGGALVGIDQARYEVQTQRVDVSECAAALRVSIDTRSGQVFGAEALLFDVRALFASHNDAQEYAQKMREMALQEKLKTAEKPEL